MSDIYHKDSINEAYQDLTNKLSAIERQLDIARQNVITLSDEADKVKTALSGLKPFIAEKQEFIFSSKINIDVLSEKPTINWQANALEIIKGQPTKKFTSPELFSVIHPQAATLDKQDRRKAMINLSLALSALVDKNKIKTVKNEGRGNLYFIEENKNELVMPVFSEV